MQVSNEVKNAYHSDAEIKHIHLSFPEIGVEIAEAQIYQESLKLSEKLMDSNSISFVGCIASQFKIQINNLKEDVKGRKITVSISTESTQEEKIPLFHGIVDSAMRQSNKRIKEIVAYDELYTKGNIDVSSWYRSLTFPLSLKQIRDSLFNYIGITQLEMMLPNDGIMIQKQYEPNTLQSLSVIKAVCQINGAFGIINRDGKFEYRILGEIKETGTYPSMTLFPGHDVFPGAGEISGGYNDVAPEGFSFYRNVDYEDFTVKPVDKLTIRQTDNDSGVTHGQGTNNYIIQGNMFTYGLSAEVLSAIARNIYPNIQGFSYCPFTSQNNGLPFLECGVDAVTYMMIDHDKLETRQNGRSARSGEIPYKNQSFYILNRELSGIQALKDSYSADGEEYQSEFITDLQTQIDIIKQNAGTDVKEYVKDYAYDKSYIDDHFYDSGQIDDMFSQFEPSSGGLKVESVSSLPSSPDQNTIYLIQGKVVVE